MSNEITKFDFYGDSLEVAQHVDGKIYVSVRRVCKALGIDSDVQRRKLQAAPWAVTVKMTATGTDGKQYKNVMIDLDALPMWLATISANKVNSALKPKLARYQCECATVLRNHFIKPTTDTSALANDRKDFMLGQFYANKIIQDACKSGALSPEFCQNYALHSAALVSGDDPQISTRLVDISGYLLSRGFTAKQARRHWSSFGVKVAAEFKRVHGVKPKKAQRFINGSDRFVNSYTDHDRPLLDRVFTKTFSKYAIVAQGKTKYNV